MTLELFDLNKFTVKKEGEKEDVGAEHLDPAGNFTATRTAEGIRVTKPISNRGVGGIAINKKFAQHPLPEGDCPTERQLKRVERQQHFIQNGE